MKLKSHAGNHIFRVVGIFFLCFFVLSLWASEQISETWLKYEMEGGFSPYEKVTITIANDGGTSVEVKKQKSSPYTYTTMLSAEEMANLQTMIRAVGFFSQPDRDTALTMDADTTLLSIKMADKSKELIFRYRPLLDPLVLHLQRLLAQAEAIQNLNQGGNAYNLLNAVSTHLSGTKALQPRTLVEPLKAFIQKSDNARNLEWAMEGLSWVTVPEEWSGFLALTFEKADKSKRELLMSILTSHPFYGSIPNSHSQAVCPLLLAYLMDNWPGIQSLSENQQYAIQGAFTVIGNNHYWPALGFLGTIFDGYDKPTISTEISPIQNMGKRGLSLLSSYLDHTSENKRLNAVELIGRAYRTHRYGQQLNPVDDYEYSLMVKLYTDRISGQLQTLAQKDISDKVRSMAQKTQKEIQADIETWKLHTKENGI